MTIMLDRILDSTLREGTQTPGVIFSPEESKRLAEKLYFVLKDRGHKGSFIEIGHPYSPVLRPQVETVANHFKDRGYDDVTLVSHCRTLRSDVNIAWKIMEKLKHPGVCVYMSIILLISSGIYELTSFAYIDSIGTLGLSYFAFKEGKECFEKANSDKYCSCD